MQRVNVSTRVPHVPAKETRQLAGWSICPPDLLDEPVDLVRVDQGFRFDLVEHVDVAARRRLDCGVRVLHRRRRLLQPEVRLKKNLRLRQCEHRLPAQTVFVSHSLEALVSRSDDRRVAWAASAEAAERSRIEAAGSKSLVAEAVRHPTHLLLALALSEISQRTFLFMTPWRHLPVQSLVMCYS